MDVRDETSNAPTTAVDSGAALDEASLETLGELVGNDPELLGSLVEVFLDEAPVRLAELSSGLETGDAILLGRAAHTLKSNAMTFGALRLADLSQRLETIAREGDLSGARALLERVELEWNLVEPLLENLCGKNSS